MSGDNGMRLRSKARSTQLCAVTTLLFVLTHGSAINAFRIGSVTWPNAEATFNVFIFAQAGDPDWSASFNQAMDEWTTTSPFTFHTVPTNADPCNGPTSSPPVNGVQFRDTTVRLMTGTRT